MDAFRYNNPLVIILVRIANMMLLSFFWACCCIPVVTIVPASAALYHTTAKVVRGTGRGISRDFFHTFAGELKTGCLLSLLCCVCGALLYYGLFLAGQAFTGSIFGTIYKAVGILFVLILAPIVLYIPAVLSRFQGGVSVILRLSAYLSSQHPARNILMFLLMAVVVFLIDYYPILLLLLPGVYTDLICGGMEKTMNAYAEAAGLLSKPGEEDSDTASVQPELTATELDRLLTEEES